MQFVKTIVFFMVSAVACGVACLSSAAVSLTDMPQRRQEMVYLQLADSEAQASGRGILNGYKGYRHHRPGYKRHSDSWWYPREAFGARPAPPPEENTAQARKALPARHVRWCEEKYLSYRSGDNSYQPYHGPRKACLSPYYRKD